MSRIFAMTLERHDPAPLQVPHEHVVAPIALRTEPLGRGAIPQRRSANLRFRPFAEEAADNEVMLTFLPA